VDSGAVEACVHTAAARFSFLHAPVELQPAVSISPLLFPWRLGAWGWLAGCPLPSIPCQCHRCRRFSFVRSLSFVRLLQFAALPGFGLVWFGFLTRASAPPVVVDVRRPCKLNKDARLVWQLARKDRAVAGVLSVTDRGRTGILKAERKENKAGADLLD
jgi:hypothetical protein